MILERWLFIKFQLHICKYICLYKYTHLYVCIYNNRSSLYLIQIISTFIRVYIASLKKRVSLVYCLILEVRGYVSCIPCLTG